MCIRDSLNTWEYNEEVYDDDELIVDNCYVVKFKVTPVSYTHLDVYKRQAL